MNPDRSGLAAYVALAYTLVIVYASLQPFSGWRVPPDDVFEFLTAAWPRHMITSDIVLNVAAYLPFGAMLFVAVPRRGATAFVIACLIATTLSLSMESAQTFLPARIASNLDLLANAGGAVAGALGAWLCSPALADAPFAQPRQGLIRPDLLGDCGFIALAVWLVIQFDPAPLALSFGDMRDALGLKPWFVYAPASYQNVETGIAALTVTVLGSLAAQIATSRVTSMLAAAIALLLTFATKSVAVWLLGRAVSPLQWLTPGVSSGLVAGVLLLLALLWLPSAWRCAIALACVAVTVILVNVTPENPYQTTPPFLLTPQPTHMSSFSTIIRVLSQLWPFTTSILLIALARKQSTALFSPGKPA